MLDIVVAADPNDPDLLVTAYQMAIRAGMPQKARQYLTDWLVLHPNDEGVRQKLNQLDAQLGGNPPSGQ